MRGRAGAKKYQCLQRKPEMNVKINISFDHRSLLAVPVTRVVRQCILATLQEEKVPVP